MNEEEYVLLQEEQDQTLERCAALERALLALKLQRERSVVKPASSLPPVKRAPLVTPALLMALSMAAVFTVFGQPVERDAWADAAQYAMPRELADVHARGMTLLACRVERAAVICAELPEDCDIARMAIGGDAIVYNLALNQMAETGMLSPEQLSSYRAIQIERLNAALVRCEVREESEPLQAMIDESRRLRSARLGR